MPMFYTPKPRQFHYKPRFYDPEKEEWEKLKTKYRLERGLPLSDDANSGVRGDESGKDATGNAMEGTGEATLSRKADDCGQPDKDLEYFQRKVRDIERKERAESQKLTLTDLFRKREKPQFHYVSRFDAEGNLMETPATATKESAVKHRITRRFDNEDDMDRFKPVPAGKILTYTLLVCLLLMFIFF